MTISKQELQHIFDERAHVLKEKEYPALAGMTPESFEELLAPLRHNLRDLDLSQPENIPLAIIVRSKLVSAKAAMQTIITNGLQGEVRMTPKQPEDFADLSTLDVPESDVYVLLDISTGRDFLNISPEECMQSITAQGRTPLTLDEGVSLAVQMPQILTDKTRYNCIQMPGSRIANDQRIPSIWLSYRRPRLGWCWNRNIHTWLGTASAASRLS